MFDSIKTRLIGLSVAVVVLTLLAATTANYIIVRGHTQSQVLTNLDALAAARGATIEQWVGTQRNIVAALLPSAQATEPRALLIEAAKSGALEAAYVAHADKSIFFNVDQKLPEGYDPTGRPWYTLAASSDGPVLTAPYIDASRGVLVVTFAQAVKEGGKATAVVASDVFLTDVVNTVKAIKPTPQGFAFLVNTKGQIIAHPDPKLSLKPVTDLAASLDGAAMKRAQDTGAPWVEAHIGEQDVLLRAVAIANTDWVLVTAADKGEALASMGALLRAAAGVLVIVLLVAGVLMTTMISTMLGGLERVRSALDEISAGGGDLTRRLPEQGRDEIARIAASFNLFTEKIQHILLDVRSASNSITTASTEIAMGAQDLSQRTEQTAANLEEAASSMEELTGTVRQTADAALTANQLVSSASAAAAKGGEVVGQVVATMDEINASSKKISDIIGVIDGIAFQTNILALNAAVEAARAGEQGRGFAVVASEVRSLAQRSAEAAKEIKGLIGASVDRVEVGSRLVEAAGNSMSDIVGSVQRVSDIIGEITAASSEQSDGIGQVNSAVVQLDQMTQQNAALVEESAAAAESLKDQARRLTEVVSVFRLSQADAGQGSHGGGTGSAASASSKAGGKSLAPAPRPAHGTGSMAHKSRPAPSSASATKPVAAHAVTTPTSPPKPAAPAPAPAAKANAAGDGDWETF
ncbi:methyl-accepting chemotaxis protein [Roseateles koreensis]|uniref:Methyl-accepting chemotaxis protein n=1 Tax=Roseateles koreensis TaxID=2987526 RepID=A0ABT5KL70_9BURK|nr:methyl-accepting chemotaxis protein [Roseateles koreensis]MDC8783624.1 methyl-accepting chemotaxis protein [Roseateles koreensis]